MTTTDHQPTDLTEGQRANLSATFVPPTDPEHGTPGYPAIQVAGALVFAYVHPDGHLQVSIHLDEAEAPLMLDELQPAVPVRVSVEAGDLYAATAIGDEAYPLLADQAQRLAIARRAVIDVPWTGLSPTLGRPLGRLVEAAQVLSDAIGTVK